MSSARKIKNVSIVGDINDKKKQYMVDIYYEDGTEERRSMLMKDIEKQFGKYMEFDEEAFLNARKKTVEESLALYKAMDPKKVKAVEKLEVNKGMKRGRADLFAAKVVDNEAGPQDKAGLSKKR